MIKSNLIKIICSIALCYINLIELIDNEEFVKAFQNEAKLLETYSNFTEFLFYSYYLVNEITWIIGLVLSFSFLFIWLKVKEEVFLFFGLYSLFSFTLDFPIIKILFSAPKEYLYYKIIIFPLIPLFFLGGVLSLLEIKILDISNNLQTSFQNDFKKKDKIFFITIIAGGGYLSIYALFLAIFNTFAYLFVLSKFLIESIKLNRKYSILISLFLGFFIFIVLINIIFLKTFFNDPVFILKLFPAFSFIFFGFLITIKFIESSSELKKLNQNLDDKVKLQTLELVTMNQKLTEELDVGKKVQGALIPSENLSFNWADVYGICLPSTNLGGDYFKIYAANGNSNGFSISLGDVSGHGVGSALIVSSVIALTNQIASKKKKTNQVMAEINKQLSVLFNFKRKSKIKYFTTSIFSNLTKTEDSVSLSFTNAGHLSPLVFRNGEFLELMDNNRCLALGISVEEPYEEILYELYSNDILLFYTDGIIEQMNPAEEQYSAQRLNDFIRKNSSLSIEEMIKALIHDVQAFAGSAPQQDDMTLVGVKLK